MIYAVFFWEGCVMCSTLGLFVCKLWILSEIVMKYWKNKVLGCILGIMGVFGVKICTP
jgi:hypothetical protein